MTAHKPDKVNLVEGGKEEFESTNEFRIKVEEIIKEVTDKYSLILLKEKRWLKRPIIKIKLKTEIERKN